MKHFLGWEIKQAIKIVFRIVFFQRCLLSFCNHAKNVFPEQLHQCSVVKFFRLAKENKWFARC